MKMHFMHVFKFQKIFLRKMRGIYVHAAFTPTSGIYVTFLKKIVLSEMIFDMLSYSICLED